MSNGKLGVTGFCWGGRTTNFLAVTLGRGLQAGVPFYGAAPETAAVASIKAPLLIQYAENDERINAMWPASRGAEGGNIQYEAYIYPGPSTAFTTTRRRATRRRRPSWRGIVQSHSSNSAWARRVMRVGGIGLPPSSWTGLATTVRFDAEQTLLVTGELLQFVKPRHDVEKEPVSIKGLNRQPWAWPGHDDDPSASAVRPSQSLQAELPSLQCRRLPRCSGSCPDDRKGWKAGLTAPMTGLRHCRLAVTIGRLFPDGEDRGAVRIVPANPGRHRGALAVAAFPMLRIGPD